ncbi:MAG: hypothetical protein WCS51_05325, partial [Bacilli bacterium]
KIDYVNGLWNKAKEARELAQMAEDEFHKSYPNVKISKPSSVDNNTNSTFNVTVNGKNIDDEKVVAELKNLFAECNNERYVDLFDPFFLL